LLRPKRKMKKKTVNYLRISHLFLGKNCTDRSGDQLG
jgi:hypothetical protein